MAERRHGSDLTNFRFGRWTVLRRDQDSPSKWMCRCDCGKEHTVLRCSLVTGNSQSCGCLHRERVAALSRARDSKVSIVCKTCGKMFRVFPSDIDRTYCGQACVPASARGNRTHGQSRTRLYRCWLGMKQRCLNSKLTAFEYYGGRGISICAEWLASFVVFRDWAMANGYSEELEIDRIDVNGNYEPSNCRWATRAEQMANTRKRKGLVTSKFKGVGWFAASNKWRALICSNSHVRHIGLFENEVDAAIAYDREARATFGEFASINFPNK